MTKRKLFVTAMFVDSFILKGKGFFPSSQALLMSADMGISDFSYIYSFACVSVFYLIYALFFYYRLSPHSV